MKAPEFDITAAHRYFAAHCFNRTWQFIEKSERTPAEDEEMLECALASLYHWKQREDCTDQNLSIGYWQVSRVHALLGQAEEARRYGYLCLTYTTDAQPFYRGYACEALARAAHIAGNAEATHRWIVEALALADKVTEKDHQATLLADLATIGFKGGETDPAPVP